MPLPVDPGGNPYIPDEGGASSGTQGLVSGQSNYGANYVNVQETKVLFKQPYIQNPEINVFYNNLIKEIESLKLNVAVMKVQLAQANSQINYLRTALSSIPDVTSQNMERLYD